MFGSLRRRGALAIAAALSFCMGSVPTAAAQPKMVHSAPRASKPVRRGTIGTATWSSARYGRKGAGITMAQQQRTAAKKRGIARNRRAHR